LRKGGRLSDKLEQIVAAYFADLRDKRGLGAGTPERSYYPSVAKLLDAVGEQLRPRVLCLSDLANTGAGQPDFGLYVANQVQKGEPRKGQSPERGVIEMKGVKDDAWVTADTKQVSKYWGAYRLVIVTNLRDFLILGEDANGRVARLETFRLAKTEAEFWEMVATPQNTAKQVGRAFGEYLRRALTQSVALREPKDVAWFIASYARDALQRVEDAGELPAEHPLSDGPWLLRRQELLTESAQRVKRRAHQARRRPAIPSENQNDFQFSST